MESFEVENFRSLKHLKLEKLARVNLLVGKNNVGKTSVLEAIYSLSGIGSSNWYDNISQGRDMTSIDVNFRQLFYKVNEEGVIKLNATYKKQLTSPHYSAALEVLLKSTNHNSQLVSEDSEWEQNRLSQRALIDEVLGVSLQTNSMSSPAHYELAATEDKAMRQLKGISKGASDVLKNIRFSNSFRLLNSFVSSRPRIRNLGLVIEQLKISKLDSELVGVLKQVDDRIERIELGSNGQIYFNLGPNFTTLLSANLMGEGVQRLLVIVSVIINRAGGLVFIDEIDNGLHYSALRILWKGILYASHMHDVQIIATTHSAEALRHLTWVLDDEENASYRDDVAAYTLIRADDDTVRSYRHDYGQLEYALEHGIEVRN